MWHFETNKNRPSSRNTVRHRVHLQVQVGAVAAARVTLPAAHHPGLPRGAHPLRPADRQWCDIRQSPANEEGQGLGGSGHSAPRELSKGLHQGVLDDNWHNVGRQRVDIRGCCTSEGCSTTTMLTEAVRIVCCCRWSGCAWWRSFSWIGCTIDPSRRSRLRCQHWSHPAKDWL